MTGVITLLQASPFLFFFLTTNHTSLCLQLIWMYVWCSEQYCWAGMFFSYKIKQNMTYVLWEGFTNNLFWFLHRTVPVLCADLDCFWLWFWTFYRTEIVGWLETLTKSLSGRWRNTPLGWGQQTWEDQSFFPAGGQWWKDVSSRMLSPALFSALSSFVSLFASWHLEKKLKIIPHWVALCLLLRRLLISPSIKMYNRLFFFKWQPGDCF